MSELDSDLKPSKMGDSDSAGAEELERGESTSATVVDRKLERRVLWKLDTRCVK
jgi:hypothetical protein